MSSANGPTADELSRLDAIDSDGAWEFDGVEIELTNLDKVLCPASADGPQVTKRDLVRYQAIVAPTMLVYLSGRPVNVQRFPNGIEQKGFWQKHVPSGAPPWLSRWENDGSVGGSTRTYAVLDRPASLVWMANQAALELHPWTSSVADVTVPNWALVDIDPGPANSVDDVVVLARLFRTALSHLGLEGGAKVTGKRGIHIWIPVAPIYTFDQTQAWVEGLSRSIGSVVPELVSWAWKTSERGGRARLDYTQNSMTHTLVAPWSVRPAPGAPVSVPIRWDELDDPDLRPDRWNVHTAMDRLAEAGDPLAPLVGRAQRLPAL